MTEKKGQRPSNLADLEWSENTITHARAMEVNLYEPQPAQAPTIIVFHRKGAEAFIIPPGGLTIGRLPPAEVILQDASVSRSHAHIFLKDDQVVVQDLGSSNGTWLNGQAISTSPFLLGDRLTIGSIHISLLDLSSSAGLSVGLQSYDNFLEDLESLLQDARHRTRGMAIMHIRQSSQQATHFSEWWVPLQRLISNDVLLSQYSHDSVELALMDASVEQARQLAMTLCHHSTTSQFNLHCGIAIFPTDGRSSHELLIKCRSAAYETNERDPIRLSSCSHRLYHPSRGPSATAIEESPIIASKPMVAIYASVARISKGTMPVLIMGETGTGKELIARSIHRQSERSAHPLHAINCGGIPETLLESTLFGHKRGAFTGAHADVKGLFEDAAGGTIFLDEIGELPIAGQTKLLRVLETRRVLRVGETKERPVDFRVIAATQRDLERMCEAGEFRWDLYYRINTITIRVPPLRARLEEIPHLIERFIAEANTECQRQVASVGPDVLAALQSYSWPGNIRELRNVIQRAVAISEGVQLELMDLPVKFARGKTKELAVSLPSNWIPSLTKENASMMPSSSFEARQPPEPELTDDDPAHAEDDGLDTEESYTPGSLDFRGRIQRYEIKLIRQALEAAGYSQSRAAQLLRIPIRTLARKIKTYDLLAPSRRASESGDE